MVHELKIAPIYFEAVRSGKKKFEVRKDDRNYQENDVLCLKEYDNNAYTGNEYAVTVTYILRGECCKDGYCIMSIMPDNNINSVINQKNADVKPQIIYDKCRGYKVIYPQHEKYS